MNGSSSPTVVPWGPDPGRRAWSAAALVVVAGLLLTPPARAQQVRGEVFDPMGFPVARAYIGLFDADRNLVVGSTADDNGVFALTAPEEGSYYVLMSRIGYRSLYDGPYEIAPEEPLELVGLMHPFPIAVDGLDVEIERKLAHLAAAGFYRRRAGATGDFLDREDLRAFGSRYVADALRAVPSVFVESSSGTASGMQSRAIFIRRRGGGFCRPTFYLDGALVQSTAFRPGESVLIEDLDGIEVYGSEVAAPMEYPARSGCGVVLLWSRSGD